MSTAAAGYFFKAVPPGGDAYILKHIIHEWDEAQARVILLEAVVPGDSRPDFSKVLDIEMMLLPGGRERTAPTAKGGIKYSSGRTFRSRRSCVGLAEAGRRRSGPLRRSHDPF